MNRYLQCPGVPPPGPYFYDPNCLTSYQAAGPDGLVSQQHIFPPPTYQVNGGGPTSGSSAPELASLQSALDFDGLLFSQGVVEHLCIVDSQNHATHLLSLSCEGSGTTVRFDLVQWLGDHGICDNPEPCSQ